MKLFYQGASLDEFVHIYGLWEEGTGTCFWQVLHLSLPWSIMLFKTCEIKHSSQRQLCMVVGLIFLENFATGCFEKCVAVEVAEQHICFTWVLANSEADLHPSLQFSSTGFWEPGIVMCTLRWHLWLQLLKIYLAWEHVLVVQMITNGKAAEYWNTTGDGTWQTWQNKSSLDFPLPAATGLASSQQPRGGCISQGILLHSVMVTEDLWCCWFWNES